MRLYIFVLTLFVIGNTFCSQAQVIGSLLNEKQIRASVNLVDEFMARFNLDVESPIFDINDNDYEAKCILYLFNGKMFKSSEDSLFVEAKSFVDTVLTNKIRLKYSDSLWYAKAKCHGKFKGKDVDFTLFLTVENRRDSMYKWTISNVDGSIFKLKPSRKTAKAMLMPDDHETNFMSLYRITTEKDDYVTYYANKKFKTDELSVFFALVYYGLLDIEYVADLEFFFLQVPGYVFSIKNFDRETDNSGWLINSFNKEKLKGKLERLKYVNNYK